MADIMDVIEHEHDQIRERLRSLLRTGDDEAKKREKIYGDVAHRIRQHISAEEKTILPTLLDRGADKDDVYEFWESHQVLRFVLDALDRTDVQDERFIGRCRVLHDFILHHHEEEEDDGGEAADEHLSKDEREQMGRNFARLSTSKEAA